MRSLLPTIPARIESSINYGVLGPVMATTTTLLAVSFQNNNPNTSPANMAFAGLSSPTSVHGMVYELLPLSQRLQLSSKLGQET
jgi:hypothetical protein